MQDSKTPKVEPYWRHRSALLVNRKLRITDNVDEQDVRDLQLNFLTSASIFAASYASEKT
jgi:hypothetical protein